MHLRTPASSVTSTLAKAARYRALAAAKTRARVLPIPLVNNYSTVVPKTSPQKQSAPPPNRTVTSSGDLGEDYSPHENYVKPTQYAISVVKRGIFYTSSAILTIALVTLLGFEGAHQWVEHVSIPASPPTTSERPQADGSDDDVWGWDIQQEGWTGGQRGGTDPQLGFRARHLLRSAWMTQHWGAGEINAVSAPPSASFQGAYGTTDGGYQLTEAFLAEALRLAVANHHIKFPPQPHPSQTALDLLSRHADILERIGSTDSITKAAQEYQLVWGGLASDINKHAEVARLAVKIGDLFARLKDGVNALGWWKRAVEYSTLSGVEADEGGAYLTQPSFTLPTALPPSPAAQRTLISALTSISAHYSSTRQLDAARNIQEASLRLISPVIHSDSTSITPPSEDSTQSNQSASATLHTLYLQHRSSLLSIHLAEVLYALSKNTSSKGNSSRWWNSTKAPPDHSSPSQIQLQHAITISERVANMLTLLSASLSSDPSSSPATLSPRYANHPILSRPAKALLRDARRSAAEAWNLSGLLLEQGGQQDVHAALQCFEKALFWAGGGKQMLDSSSGDVLEKEWALYWKNYTRLLNRVAQP